MQTKILFICHGNICRSPMAEFVMKHLIAKAGLSAKIQVASCATSTEEIGHDTHRGTKQKLTEMKIPYTPRHAVQLTPEDYSKYDLLIAMDHNNLRNIKQILQSDPDNKIHLLLSFANENRDIADPWYTGNFDQTYEDVTLGCQALLRQLKGEASI